MTTESIRAPKLRVFTYNDVAYQVNALATHAVEEISLIFLRIDGRAAERVNMTLTESTYYATRLSTAAEWFDLTLRKAAHDYLDVALDAERRWYRSVEPCEDPAFSAVGAFIQVKRAFYRGEIVTALSSAEPTSLFGRVNADIVARLCGNEGETQRP